jgi:hypothetical protein
MFSWEAVPDLVNASARVHAAAAHHRILAAIEKSCHSTPDRLASILDILLNLPQRNRIRFITAPEASSRAQSSRSSEESFVDFISESLSAELLLAKQKDVLICPCWTALGDFYFDTPLQEDPELLAYTTPQPAFFMAPQIGNAIPIDIVSPYAQTGYRRNSEDGLYGAWDIQEIAVRLDRVLDMINAVAPEAVRLILSAVKVIVVRRTNGIGCGSSSQNAYPGRVLLYGIERMSDMDLAMGLVHEAMHQLMYFIEEYLPFIRRTEGGRLIRIKSPWTGNPLSIYSYFHACFVWFGLAKFCRHARARGVFPKADVELNLAKALGGFRSVNPARQLQPHEQMIEPTALTVLRSLRPILRAAFAETS